jgi:ABC-type branched-subunit amino acid transport system permease subunit
MSTVIPPATTTAERAIETRARARRPSPAYWTGFALVVAALAVSPFVLPEFWQKFMTEILIWGLFAMSSDLLIGYTGMVSFGHSAFFGLGMYGAAAALIAVRPPDLWLAILVGLVAAAVIAAFVAFFSTRLRDIYFSITTLVFSQIFYVIIFTWTEVTGGENGLTFRQPPFPSRGTACTGSCSRRWSSRTSSCAASRSRPSAWCSSRSARTSRARAPSGITSSATRSSR